MRSTIGKTAGVSLAGVSLAAMAISILGADQAVAQTSATESSVGSIKEVIVTAQRRSERLQDVPLSITAMSASQTAAAGVKNLEDVGGRIPGVYFKNLNAAQPQAYIRAIGTVQFDNSSEAPVGTFVDDVYIARFSAGLSDLYDIDRIEVLRGPQGTLYGRNTIGGAINVITRDPTRETSGEFGVETGSFSAIRTHGAIGGAISENVAGRLAFATNKRDGWTSNPVTGKRANDDNSDSARGKLLFEPTDRLRFKLSADYTRDRLAGFEQKIKGVQNLGIAPPQVDPFPNSPYVSGANVAGFQNRDIYGVSLRSEADLMPSVGLTSITAYQHHKFEGLRDLDAGPAPVLAAAEHEKGYQFSQEFRLASSGDSDFKWLAGLYFFTENSIRTETWTLGGLNPGFPYSLFAGNYNWTFDGGAKSYAAFTQESYAFTKRLELVAGLRYSVDHKSGSYITRSDALYPLPVFISPAAGFTSHVSKSWHSLDPAVTLNFRPDDQSLIYASYKTGFKSGGFQQRPYTMAVSVTPFKPERLKAYEVGVKSEWLERRLTANFSAFHYDYNNMQQLDLVPGSAPPVTFTSNIASARVQGIEAEIDARPLQGLDLELGYAYLDAKYLDYVDPSGVQRRGNHLNRAPENAVNTAVEYTKALADLGDLAFRLEYLWRDKIFFLQDNSPVNTDDALGLLNARIAFTTDKDRVTVALSGSNLTGKVYCANQIVSVPSSSAATCAVGAPRQWSLTLDYHLD